MGRMVSQSSYAEPTEDCLNGDPALTASGQLSISPYSRDFSREARSPAPADRGRREAPADRGGRRGGELDDAPVVHSLEHAVDHAGAKTIAGAERAFHGDLVGLHAADFSVFAGENNLPAARREDDEGTRFPGVATEQFPRVDCREVGAKRFI